MIRASDLLHVDERKPPTTEVLYGREWSAEDAAYARQLQEDKSLSAVDITRLWAENRPSVRAARATENPLPATVNGSPVVEIGGPATEKRRGRPPSDNSLSSTERSRLHRERKARKD
jgi:hypothetical protein